MRFLAENMTTLASGVAVLLAAGMAYRVRLPWLVTSYLVAQCLFAFLGWVALCRPEMYHSKAYLVMFTVLFFPLQLLTLSIGCDFRVEWRTALGLIVSTAMAVIFGSLRLYSAIAARGGDVDMDRVRMCLGWGATMICGGFLTVLALSDPLSTEMRYAVRSLAVFWLTLGAWMWAYANSQSQKWDKANVFVTPMIALVCFAWMCWSLRGPHAELATQQAQDEFAVSELEHLEASL